MLTRSPNYAITSPISGGPIMTQIQRDLISYSTDATGSTYAQHIAHKAAAVRMGR